MRFGVVTGLKLEAGRFTAPNPEQLIASGAGSGAREACGRLIDAGAEALLGFGLAGGLAPGIGSGDVVLASAIRLPSGAVQSCDGLWRTHLQALLREVPRTVHAGLLLGSDRVIGTPAEKRALAASGAIAVDTESHHLAAMAAEAGRAFAVIRVIVDRAQDRLPPFLADCYDGDGGLRLRALIGGLLRQPRELPSLWRLARQSRRALASLSGVGRLGAALGPP